MSTFVNQKKLPRLPVPALKESIQQYLDSVQPFQTVEEHQKTRALASAFETGIGTKLQERLEEYAKTQENWLEKWWLQLAYHGWRESSMVNSNWYMLVRDHPAFPAPLAVYERNNVFVDGQLIRASGLIFNALMYMDAIIQ